MKCKCAIKFSYQKFYLDGNKKPIKNTRPFDKGIGILFIPNFCLLEFAIL